MMTYLRGKKGDYAVKPQSKLANAYFYLTWWQSPIRDSVFYRMTSCPVHPNRTHHRYCLIIHLTVPHWF